MDELIPRAAADQLAEAAQDFRVTVVNGPRQAGKTTLLELFQAANGGTYRSLDDAEHRRAALADPISYVDVSNRPLMIDEVQRGGDELVLAIKRAVDRDRTPGQFILSGSSRFLTVPTLSESLAGRAAFVDLWPFCMAERTRGGHDFLSRGFGRPAALLGTSSEWTRREYLELITTGSFPEAIRISSTTSRRRWFAGYLRTVVSRDIQDFADIRHAAALPRLIALIAARSGGTLVLSDIAQTLGLSVESIRTYLSYFETVFLMVTVPAWSTNFTSRITKAPKAFLTDAGLASSLVRADEDSLATPGHHILGALVETFVFTELLKIKGLTGDAFEIYHFRDRDGREIDFILETPDGRIFAIEVKASASPSSKDARHLTWLRDRLGDRFAAGIVLHLGAQALSYGDRILALPISALWGNLRLA